MSKKSRTKRTAKKKALKNTGRGIDTLLSRAKQAHQAGQWEEADATYQKILLQHPYNAEVLHLRGIICTQTNRYECAIRLMKQALEIEPDVHLVHYNIARAYAAQDTWDEAVFHCQKAVKLEPGHVSSWFNLGNALSRLKRHDEAFDAFLKATELVPDDPQLLNNLGNSYTQLGEHDNARKCFEKALALSPDSALLHHNLASNLLNAGELALAVSHARQALDREPRMWEAHLTLANALEKSGNLDEAEHAARAALSQVDNEQTRFRLGYVLQSRGEFDEARLCYEKSLEHNPDGAVALNNLGLLAKDEGRMEQAIALFTKAIDKEEGYAAAWINLANALEKDNQLEEAKTAARKGVALDPSPDAYLRLGYIQQRLQDHEAAVTTYRTCLELDPSDRLGVRLHLASLGIDATPDRAPDEFVKNLFDKYSGIFDEHLTQFLEYRGPEVLLSALHPWLGGMQRPERITLDMGCGTGLCGMVLKPFSRRLDGIDLSPRMIAQADKRGIYDTLAVSELVDYLDQTTTIYDLVVAGDVFVYIGNLEHTFQSVVSVLAPGGLFAFTVEKNSGPEPYLLTGNNRYTHTSEYLEELAQQYGLQVDVLEETSTRQEEHIPVACYVVVLSVPV